MESEGTYILRLECSSRQPDTLVSSMPLHRCISLGPSQGAQVKLIYAEIYVNESNSAWP